MDAQLWKLEDAKAQFSYLVESAMRGRAQHVTRRGKPAVVVLAESEYQAMQRCQAAQAPSFVAHLLAMPKAGRTQKPIPAGKPEPAKAAQARDKLILREIDFS